MDFIAYHDRTGQDHQNHFNTLFPQGYRMISLSLYQRSNPLYAAVWVRRPGPDWSAVHGVGAAGYQTSFDQAAAAGFHPIILSAAGPINDPVFAGLFEQRPGPVPLTRFGLTSGNDTDPGTIQHWDRTAHEKKWIMTGGAVYGDLSTPAYAGIWPGNDRGVAWSAEGILDQSMLNRTAILSMLNLAAHSGRPRAGHGFDVVTPISDRATAAKKAAICGRRRTRSASISTGSVSSSATTLSTMPRYFKQGGRPFARPLKLPRGRRGRTTSRLGMPAFR